MALLSLGESKWRMLRRALRKKTFAFGDVRNMTRQDKAHFDTLVKDGFFAAAGKGTYAVTDKGRAAAELGFYEFA